MFFDISTRTFLRSQPSEGVGAERKKNSMSETRNDGNRSEYASQRREVIKRVGAAIAIAAGTATKGHAQSSIAFASWIHGNTGHVERPELAHEITPFGFGLEVQSRGAANWVHYGIPTPVIVNENRLKILRAMIVFETANPYAQVQSLHVWDGAVQLAKIDGLALSGRHPFEAFPIPNTPTVQFGITISIGFALTTFEFGPLKFGFISAGADFV
jgi:uncharacterized protein DUF6623